MSNISSTTWALLAYSKMEYSEFDWKSIRTNVLGDLYHYDMRLDSVMRILLNCIEEIQLEPRFKLHYGKDFIKNVILEPLKFSMFGKPVDKMNTEEVYNKMISQIMYGMRFTRADWCKEILSTYKETLDIKK
jgi:hypothetical protein